MRSFAPWPLAPGNGATIVMFTTHDRAAGGAGALSRPSIANADQRRIAAITLQFLRNDQASAANGVRVYAFDVSTPTASDRGTWREIDLKDDSNLPTIGSAAPVAVPILAAGQEYRVTMLVPHCAGVAVEYTAGPAGPTNFNGVITVEEDDLAVLR